MSPAAIEHRALELYQALRNRKTILPLNEQEPFITLDDAYQISLAFLKHRLDDGEKLIGKKIGLTSDAVQNMLGVHQPDFGFLTDKMLYQSGVKLPFEQSLIQAKSEGEIAFILKHDLRGPDVTPQAVIEATEAVVPCVEIVESRVQDWRIKIEDTVADNASCGLFILGEQRVDPKLVDFECCKMVIQNHGKIVAEGKGSAALGSPLNCVAWLANTLGNYGQSLNAGDIILSGSLAAMIPCQAGDDMTMEIEGIGTCSYQFIE